MPDTLLLDSVTRLGPDAAGRICIGASHAGVYAAYLCARAGLRGVVLHEAGIGRDGAAIAGLAYLDALGLPAAAMAGCTVGDVADCAARGVISRRNAAAEALGIAPGMTAREAATLLDRRAPEATRQPPPSRESRFMLPGFGAAPVVAMDSASLMLPVDAGAIVACGSHGNILGGDPATAAKIDVFGAIYNDAGQVPSRLPALQVRGIAAATVAAMSARIGDGRSTATDGVISHANAAAIALGVIPGMSAQAALERLASAWAQANRP